MKLWALRIVVFLLLAAGASAVTMLFTTHVLEAGPFAQHWRNDRTRSLTTTGTMLAAWQKNADRQSLQDFMDRSATAGYRYALFDSRLRQLAGDTANELVHEIAQTAFQTKKFASDKANGFPPPETEVTEAAAFTGLDGKTYVLAATIYPRAMPGRPPMKWRVIVEGAGVMVALIMLVLLVRMTDRPAREMRQALRRLSKGDMDVRMNGATGRRGDALSLLAGEFNILAENIARKRTEQDLLIGSISHEMRSPLSRMALALQLARDSAPGTTDGLGSSRLLDRIDRDTERLNALADQMLALTRMQNGPSKHENVDLAQLVDEIAETCGFEAADKGCTIAVKNSLAPGAGNALIGGDIEQLVSMLENILRNAVRHSPAGGKVTVSMESGQRSGRNCIALRVSDSGPGVPEDKLQRIFEPFFQGENGGTSGLGLAIAHHVAVSHGGRIHAANRPGGGLQVTIHLPMLRHSARLRTPEFKTPLDIPA